MHDFHYVRDHVISNHHTILDFIHLCDCDQISRLFVSSEDLSDIVSSTELLLR